MILLKDVNYEESKTKLTTEIIRKNVVEDGITQVELKFVLNFGFGSVSRNITWTNYDIETVLSQIENIDGVGEISALEPDLSFFYTEVEQDQYLLYVDLDAGVINSNMGTESGVSLKMQIKKDDLLKWINEIDASVKRA
ncbi:hypothetical protein [Siminovitchia fortis]|uniref:hypothetical protein n=1 Tax=Siminovitchia fortis TaxID=254758 RepID=UPI0011A78046|nr:hypothetical protein [Siminovitchia fortis]